MTTGNINERFNEQNLHNFFKNYVLYIKSTDHLKTSISPNKNTLMWLSSCTRIDSFPEFFRRVKIKCRYGTLPEWNTDSISDPRSPGVLKLTQIVQIVIDFCKTINYVLLILLYIILIIGAMTGFSVLSNSYITIKLLYNTYAI